MLNELLEFGGLGLAGGVISDVFGSKQAAKNRQLTREQMQMMQRQFDAQMDQSIQRRVVDARSAGIHPIFALGGGIGASPTAAIGGGEPVRGSETGRAIANLGASLAEARIRQGGAAAKRDEAEAQLLDARRAVIEQELNHSGRDTISEISVYPKQPLAWQSQIAKHRRERKGVPLYVNVYDQRTGQQQKLFNPALGLDEVGQLLYLNQQGKADRDAIIQWLGKKARQLNEGIDKRLSKYEWYRKTDRFMRQADAEIRRLIEEIGEKL